MYDFFLTSNEGASATQGNVRVYGWLRDSSAQGYFPSGLKDTVMKGYEGAGLDDVFSEKAEMINGRAAMLGLGFFLATATIF